MQNLSSAAVVNGALRATCIYPVPLEAVNLVEETNITYFDSCTSYAYQLKQPHAYTYKMHSLSDPECFSTCRLYTETLVQTNAKSYTARNEVYFINTTRNESKKEGKDQGSIQSSITPDPGYQWESDNFTIRLHKREPSGQPFPSNQ